MSERTKVVKLLSSDKPLADVLVKGWVRTRRDAKDFSFIEVNDGSCLKNIQVIAGSALPNYEDVKKLTTGSSVAVSGALVPSQGGNQKYEIKAEKIEVYGWADDTYPLQKKKHTDEYLRTIAHLRPRTNKYGAAFRIRSELSYAIHTFFHERGFRYVHTPIITASDCEGAGEMFQVTTLDLNNLPKTPDGKVDYSQDFFGKEARLTVSGQLNGEMYATALGDIYTFGPTFRAENSNTTRHAAEFWMIEPEMAFADLDDNIELAIVDSMKCCSRILKEMELDIGVQYTCIFRRHHLCLIKGHDLMERVKHRLIRSEYKCVLAVTLILRVLLCKQELIEDASSNQDSLAESHSQSVDIVRIVLLKLLHLLEDSFILIVAQVDKAELSVLMDTIIGGVREPVAAVPPIIEDLIHMSIIKKLLDKYIHFQRVELRLTEESIGIFALIVICEELSCQVIVTGAYLTTVLYIESP